VTVKLQWCRIWEIKMGKERRWGATIFREKEGEEGRRLHGAVGR
jgi:hypothetical protein